MRWLQDSAAKIDQLIEKGDASSLTYAALECRLAIERICYERLRLAHDYISADDLRKWQPNYVIKTLIQDVDENIASTYTLSIGTTPLSKGAPTTVSDYEKLAYVPVGTQIGFDPKRLSSLWNALGNFLHVRMPKSKKDSIDTYGDSSTLLAKLEEANLFLKELEKGTLIGTGFGEQVSFTCNCGQLNKRKANLLYTGKVFNCINPECKARWKSHIVGGEFEFEEVLLDVKCAKCGELTPFPERMLKEMPRGHMASFDCECGQRNYVRWGLVQAHWKGPTKDPSIETP